MNCRFAFLFPLVAIHFPSIKQSAVRAKCMCDGESQKGRDAKRPSEIHVRMNWPPISIAILHILYHCVRLASAVIG